MEVDKQLLSLLAIGAYANNGVNGPYSGHVRVYEYSQNTWTQIGGDIDGEAADDQSGYSVAMSSDGTIIAIGSPYNDGSTENASDNRGHLRVYSNRAPTSLFISEYCEGSDKDRYLEIFKTVTFALSAIL